MMRGISICLFSVLIASCTTATQTYTPSGRLGYSIACSGNYQSWSDCYTAAGRKCGTSGYKIVEKIGDTGGVATASIYSASAQVLVSRTLVVECGHQGAGDPR